MARISILMNCYNSAAFLREALKSVYAQTFSDWEIIFIDNCSTDNSASIIKEFDERIKYFRTAETIPLYAARKFGLPKAQGEFLCILDCDDIWEPQKLEKQIQLMDKENTDFIFSNFINFYSGNSFRTKFKYNLHALRHNLKRKLIGNGYKAPSELLKYYYINLQTVMIRRSKLKDLNFDERYNLIGDFDFFLRLFKFENIRPYYLNSTLSRTRTHSSQLTRKLTHQWEVEAEMSLKSGLENTLDQDEKKSFLYLIDKYKLNRLKNEGNRDAMVELLKKHKSHSFRDYFNFLKSYLQ